MHLLSTPWIANKTFRFLKVQIYLLQYKGFLSMHKTFQSIQFLNFLIKIEH